MKHQKIQEITALLDKLQTLVLPATHQEGSQQKYATRFPIFGSFEDDINHATPPSTDETADITITANKEFMQDSSHATQNNLDTLLLILDRLDDLDADIARKNAFRLAYLSNIDIINSNAAEQLTVEWQQRQLPLIDQAARDGNDCVDYIRNQPTTLNLLRYFNFNSPFYAALSQQTEMVITGMDNGYTATRLMVYMLETDALQHHHGFAKKEIKRRLAQEDSEEPITYMALSETIQNNTVSDKTRLWALLLWEDHLPNIMNTQDNDKLALGAYENMYVELPDMESPVGGALADYILDKAACSNLAINFQTPHISINNLFYFMLTYGDNKPPLFQEKVANKWEELFYGLQQDDNTVFLLEQANNLLSNYLEDSLLRDRIKAVYEAELAKLPEETRQKFNEIPEKPFTGYSFNSFYYDRTTLEKIETDNVVNFVLDKGKEIQSHASNDIRQNEIHHCCQLLDNWNVYTEMKSPLLRNLYLDVCDTDAEPVLAEYIFETLPLNKHTYRSYIEMYQNSPEKSSMRDETFLDDLDEFLTYAKPRNLLETMAQIIYCMEFTPGKEDVAYTAMKRWTAMYNAVSEKEPFIMLSYISLNDVIQNTDTNQDFFEKHLQQKAAALELYLPQLQQADNTKAAHNLAQLKNH